MTGSGERKTEREKSLGLPTVVALQKGVTEGVVLSRLSLCRICVLFSKSEDELLNRIQGEHRRRRWEALNRSGENELCGNKQC